MYQILEDFVICTVGARSPIPGCHENVLFFYSLFNSIYFSAVGSVGGGVIFGSGSGVWIFFFLLYIWATVLGGHSALTTATPLLPGSTPCCLAELESLLTVLSTTKFSQALKGAFII